MITNETINLLGSGLWPDVVISGADAQRLTALAAERRPLSRIEDNFDLVTTDIRFGEYWWRAAPIRSARRSDFDPLLWRISPMPGEFQAWAARQRAYRRAMGEAV